MENYESKHILQRVNKVPERLGTPRHSFKELIDVVHIVQPIPPEIRERVFKTDKEKYSQGQFRIKPEDLARRNKKSKPKT